MNRLSSDSFSVPNAVSSSSCKQKRSSLCVRTDAEGYIPIEASWPALFQTLKSCESYYIQSRHAYARLVANSQLLDFEPVDDERIASQDQRLILRRARGHTVRALIDVCDCCGSPGRIEFINEFGLDVLQICSDPHVQPFSWGQAVIDASLIPSDTQAAKKPEPVLRVPKTARRLKMQAENLSYVIELCSHKGVPLNVELVSTGVRHRESFVPSDVQWWDGLLSATNCKVTAQLSLTATKNLFIDINEEGHPTLFAAGPSDVQLFAFSPVASEAAVEDFNLILKDLNPV